MTRPLISKKYLKTALFFFLSCFLLCSVSFAVEYSFQWDPNHPNDNVVKYRIYWRSNSSNYNPGVFEEIEINNPAFDPVVPAWTISLDNAADEYCFTATAIDEEDFESDFSTEVGKGSTCGQLIIMPEDPEDDFDKKISGGSGGGCFLSVTDLFLKNELKIDSGFRK